MYSLVLSYHKRPKLRSIDATHRFVLETIAESIGRVVNGVARAGISDLVIGDKKFSGNSLRIAQPFAVPRHAFAPIPE